MKKKTDLDPERPPVDVLEDLVVDCIARVEETGPAAVDELCRRHPDSAAALRRRMDALLHAGLLETPAGAPAPRRLGDFTLLEPLGGGGMGLVYRARQESLSREVALKLVRPELLDLPGTRARFRREVDALARLAHPNLVGVHAVGEEGGVPFLALELLVGATLAELLDELEGQAPERLRGADLAAALERSLARKGADAPPCMDLEAPAFEGGWVRSCVRIALDVALALDHAHAAGVLHRDVKPSNVLLGTDGRARLFDFGLALPEEADALTRTGAMVGSLPYMAPEQALGAPVDRRTDVYGLGATLAEMLALRPPFDERHPEALRAAIVAGDPPSPRRRNRAVPRDLERVCAKALARDPARRYASAGELARDLANVLAGRPVLARAGVPAAVARRFARRHPAATAAIAVALVAAVGTPSAIAWQRGVANRSIAEALDVARTESARAEANLDTALEAVADMLGAFGDEVRSQPLLGPEGAAMLARATDLYGALMAQRPDDLDLVRQHAALRRQQAEVLDVLGREADGVAANAAAERAFRSLLARDPGSLQLKMDLADTLSDGADPARRRGDEAESLARYAEAEALIDAVLGAQPPAAPALSSWAVAARRQVRFNVASVHLMAGRTEQGQAPLAGALEDARRMVADGHPRGRRALLATRQLEAAALSADDPGLEAFGALFEEIEAELGDTTDAQELDLIALAAHNLGYLLFTAHRLDELDRVTAVGVDAAERLIRSYPYVREYQERLISMLQNQAFGLVARDRLDEALSVFERNVAARARLAAAHPGEEELLTDLAFARHNYACGLLDAGRRADAREPSRLAREHFEKRTAAGQATLAPFTAYAAAAHAQSLLSEGTYPGVDALERLFEERAPRDARAWSALAAVFGDASACAAQDAAADPAERAPRAERYAAAAVRALARAAAEGYAMPAVLDGTRELDTLRGRPDFEAVMVRLRE